MNNSKYIENNFFRNLRKVGIALNVSKLPEVDTGELRYKTIHLKSKKEIDNTIFELINNIISCVISVQNYKDDRSYEKLDSYVNKLANYLESNTEVETDNFKNYMKYLSVSSRESIVNSEVFTDFNKYIHINRPIGDRLKEALKKLNSKEKGIILVVGSVGDGKSHLLSYLNENYPELLTEVEIYNDATESDNPYRTAVETLINKLKEYKRSINKKLVIAINIGMLHNLNEKIEGSNELRDLSELIEGSRIFSEEVSDINELNDEEVTVVSFLTEKPFIIKNGEVSSDFYNEIMKKIFSESESNPFYENFVRDDGFNRKESIYRNYKLMLNEKVQETVIRLLIKIQIENKRMITTRALLNLIHDLIVPEKDDESNNSLLVNLLFESPERSNLLKAVNTQDPALVQNANIDKLNVDLYNSLDFYSKCLELFGEEDYKNIEEYILLFDGLSHERKFKMIVRLHYLLNYKDYESIVYLKYIEALENIEKDKRMIKDLLMKIRKAVESWNGSPENGFIYKDSIDYTSKMRIGIEFKYTLKSIRVTNQLTIEVILNVQGEDYKLVIDYNLYKLLTDIENGYILKEKDKSEAIVFAEFVDKVITSIVSNEKTIMTLTDNNKKYEITEGFLGFEIKEVN